MSLKLTTKIVAVFVLLLAVVYCFIEADGNGDFFIFISASHYLNGTTNIYAHKFLEFYHYYYSVLFALLLKPFYFLPFVAVKFSWLLLNLFLYYHLFQLLAKSQYIAALTLSQQRFFLTAVFLFSVRFLHENIHTSQITILILWCSVYGIYWIHTGKTYKGSFILAMGINIKLLPIVALPYLLYRGYFKAFAITVSLYAFTIFAPGFIIGHTYNFQLFQNWFKLINPTNQQHIMDVDERSFHSLTTLLTTLFIENPPDPLAMPLKRNIANIPESSLSHLILVTRFVLAGFTLYFLRTKPFKKAISEFNDLATLAYLLLLVPLIFPHQQHYAFLFITPAFAIALYMLIKNYKSLRVTQRNVILVLLSFIYLVSNLKLLLGEFNHYYEHFKLLTYGALLLIPLLVWTMSFGAKTKVNSKAEDFIH
jgi:hypothetical protein